MIDPLDVPHDAVRQFWPQVRPLIEKALSATPVPYIAEDVYGSLINGMSTLHVTTDESREKITGCFVINKRVLVGGTPELYVWIAAHENPDHGINAYLDWLDRLTRKAGCFRWSGDSPRPFHKIVPGLRLESHHFVREV